MLTVQHADSSLTICSTYQMYVQGVSVLCTSTGSAQRDALLPGIAVYLQE